MRRLLVLLAVAMLAVAMMAAPAVATVHPVASGDCSGAGPFSPAGGDPPGITDGSAEEADNFAEPLFATGVLIGFDADGPIIDEDNPALNGDNGNCPNGAEEF